MKYLALAMLLAVMQATPPVQRKTATPSSDPASNATKQDSSKAPTDTGTRETPVTRETALVSRADKDWWDKAYVIFEGLLVIVGVAGVGYAIKTLRAIQRQALVMTEQREVMQGQFETMHGQLAAMKSSGEQTDRLIGHAAAQVETLSVAAQAAKENAEAAQINAMNSENAALAATANARAAQLSAQAIVNSERPWMMIEIAPIPGAPKQGYVSFRAWNRGRTPAEVTYYQGDFFFHGIDAPFALEPTFEPREFLFRQYVSPGKDVEVYGFSLSGSLPPDQWERMQREQKYLYFKGRIVYRDIINGDEHESRFCYWLSPADGVGLIMGGHRNWNKYT